MNMCANSIHSWRSRELASVWSPNGNAAFYSTSITCCWKKTQQPLHPLQTPLPPPVHAAVWIMKSPLPLGSGPGVKNSIVSITMKKNEGPCLGDECGVLVHLSPPTPQSPTPLHTSCRPVTHTLPPPSHAPPAHHSLSLCHPLWGKMKPVMEANLPFHLPWQAQSQLSDAHACRANTHAHIQCTCKWKMTHMWQDLCWPHTLNLIHNVNSSPCLPPKIYSINTLPLTFCFFAEQRLEFKVSKIITASTLCKQQTTRS